ncbi:hypothetical protein PC129_g23439 [Phytophthora cactorum]|uniref:Uncharacterized protein n=1 Tax=Phytophthora cactorum TaxID=29920 RepID=A0A8T1A919_9STRA|nr:hypothetical protein PC111_g19700 [Phytophthora cactorum]KAG2834370.1 hypothetical protein PC112_g6095 [Phytophthora cactorum]KAG2875892.1 hypothetical protein PC115_g23778 [Phytophthora cactorum]KAG3201756.1 hypothetical protein PC129_g23439 [Phytophthora cactorum]KAG4042534.1 hypothetical protein PC123_g21974 [Phytophthora cactorum]
MALLAYVLAGVGCPHPTCIRESTASRVHIFWTCPAATELRHVLLGRWFDGLPEVDTDRLQVCLAKLVESRWRLGAVVYLHGLWK